MMKKRKKQCIVGKPVNPQNLFKSRFNALYC